MESLNLQLFTMINADAVLHGPRLMLAIVVAEYLIYLVPILLVFLWLRTAVPEVRSRLLFAFAAAMLAVGINQLIGLVYFHPRPFMIGMGHTWLGHAADSSFPSDHVTILVSVGLALIFDRTTRRAGLFFLLLAPTVAWARVYLGIHFPFDMAGAVAVALLTVGLLNTFYPLLEQRIFLPFERFYQMALATVLRRKVLP